MPSRNLPRKSPRKKRPVRSPPRAILTKKLKARLRGATRVIVLGVGSDLRGDDVAGLLVAQELEKRFGPVGTPLRGVRGRLGGPSLPVTRRARRLGPPPFCILDAGTAPENFTGEIRRFNPSHLVMVDAADMGKAPGTVALLSPDEIEGVAFSTHQLPLKLMIKFLGEDLKFETFFIGIQPRNLSFGAPVSREVRSATNTVVDALIRAWFEGPGSL